MDLRITDLSKAYQRLDEKETAIYKLSGYTLDDIIERLAKGFEFVPPKSTASLEEMCQALQEIEAEAKARKHLFGILKEILRHPAISVELNSDGTIKLFFDGCCECDVKITHYEDLRI